MCLGDHHQGPATACLSLARCFRARFLRPPPLWPAAQLRPPRPLRLRPGVHRIRNTLAAGAPYTLEDPRPRPPVAMTGPCAPPCRLRRPPSSAARPTIGAQTTPAGPLRRRPATAAAAAIHPRPARYPARRPGHRPVAPSPVLLLPDAPPRPRPEMVGHPRCARRRHPLPGRRHLEVVRILLTRGKRHGDTFTCGSGTAPSANTCARQPA